MNGGTSLPAGALLYYHKETDCDEHLFHNAQFITVVDEDGYRLQLDVELCNESYCV